MTAAAPGDLRFGVLGPTLAWSGRQPLELGSPQQRAVLAALILHRDRVVPTRRLVETLWPAAAPANGVQVVRTYVSRLRGGPLAGAAGLETHHGGYRLRAAPGQVDADRFEGLVDAARRRLEAQDAPAAEALLHEALALVRGEPYDELGDDEDARIERERLRELVELAREELVEAGLAQGRHGELVAPLRAAVRVSPLRERGWGQLMVALYRAGRQAEALAAYREAHRELDALGLVPGRRLRELEAMVLVQDPWLDLPSPPAQWLPVHGTSFVGRAEEREALGALLRTERLVTLTGPAGVGKTRLAAEVVARLDAPAGHRRAWADLASVPAPRVAAAVARALRVPEVPGRADLDLIVAALQDAPALLVLDNCEHALEEVAALASRVVGAAPAARILCTSREPLGVEEERLQRLAGLDVPPEGTTDPQRLLAHAAARLLVERAGTAVAVRDLDDRDTAALAEVTRRLDGLPLALELAAGKLRVVAPAELVGGLRRRLAVVGDARSARPRRQRSVEAAIAWSHDLLPPREQVVLRRLAVFAGTFEAAAAEAVAGEDALAAVAHLADASLLEVTRHVRDVRYRLLETVRAFALERLRASGEEEAIRRRHLGFAIALAERVDRGMMNTGLATWLPRARLEHDQLHATLRWALDGGDPDGALRLAGHLSAYWFRSGRLLDGRRLLEAALEGAPSRSPWRPRALAGRAQLTHASADALAAADEGVAAVEASGDREWLALVLEFRALALVTAGRLGDAAADVARARTLARACDSLEATAFADQVAGCVALRLGELDRAERLLLDARGAFRRMRGTYDAGFTLIDLARVAMAQGRPEVAAGHAAAALEDFRRREDPRGTAGALIQLGRARRAAGDDAAARGLLADARDLAERWGYTVLVREAEEALAE